MKKFRTPKLTITTFSAENIVTLSDPSASAQSLANELAVSATNGVNIVNWNTLNAE